MRSLDCKLLVCQQFNVEETCYKMQNPFNNYAEYSIFKVILSIYRRWKDGKPHDSFQIRALITFRYTLQ